jgi:hypothetical protein
MLLNSDVLLGSIQILEVQKEFENILKGKVKIVFNLQSLKSCLIGIYSREYFTSVSMTVRQKDIPFIHSKYKFDQKTKNVQFIKKNSTLGLHGNTAESEFVEIFR